MKKNSRVIVFVLILIVFLVGLFFFARMIDNKKVERIVYTKQELQEKYLKKAKEYLKKKYNRDFVLSLYNDGYKTKEIWFDTTFECGHDKNIKQYVYEVTSELPFTTYITVWINSTTGEEDIHEGNGVKSIRDNTSFGMYYESYMQKMEIKNDIENHFNNLGYDYKLDVLKNENVISISLERDFIEEINDDYCNIKFLKKLLTDKKINIRLNYTNFSFFVSSYEQIGKDNEFLKEIFEYMNNNFNGLYYCRDDYSEYSDSYYTYGVGKIHIRINKNIKNTYETETVQYNDLIDNLYDIIIRNDKASVVLKFDDINGYISKDFRVFQKEGFTFTPHEGINWDDTKFRTLGDYAKSE